MGARTELDCRIRQADIYIDKVGFSVVNESQTCFSFIFSINSQQAKFNYWQWRLRINYTGYVCLHRRKWQHKYFFSFHTQRFSSLGWIQQHNKDWLVLSFISLLNAVTRQAPVRKTLHWMHWTELSGHLITFLYFDISPTPHCTALWQ